MGMTNYLANEILDHILRGEAFTAPTELYVGLWKTTATVDATSTGSTTGEMDETGYSRFNITPGTGEFDAGSGGATDNTNAITFGPVTENADEVDTVAILDASSAGNMLFFGSLDTARTLQNGDSASFAAGDLDWTVG